MDKKEIVVLLFSSAVIGALFSAAITAFAQWRERVARQKELLLKVSVELSKTYIDRITSLSKTLAPVPEFSVLPLMHNMVQEIFECGSVSVENKQKMKDLANMFNEAVNPE
ncbi:MAG: hypothetical protein ABSG08_18175 [Terriglobales bacterium]|jgi:hypothetical protein